MVPLVEAWFYGWLGVPDDRLVGIVSVLFYLALVGVCHTAVRRLGRDLEFASVAAFVVASIPHVAGLSGLVFADVPLAVFATIAAVYLVEWLEGTASHRLAIAAAGCGIDAVDETRRHRAPGCALRGYSSHWAGNSSRVARCRGPFFCRHAVVQPVVDIRYLERHRQQCLSACHDGDVPWRTLFDCRPSAGECSRTCSSPAWSFVWPLCVLCGLFGRRATSPATDSSQ